MSLQFIFGNSGSGKSHYLYQQIVEESIRHPEKNYLVLVPEQFTMQTQKDLCMAHPRGGIMNIDVLSFGRLAHRCRGIPHLSYYRDHHGHQKGSQPYWIYIQEGVFRNHQSQKR